jgi:iron complex outermembrane receptor protein
VSIFGQNVPFDSYPDTPRVSGSFNATVTLPTPDVWGEMTVRADSFSQTDTYFASNSGSIDPRVHLPGYTTFNMRYSWDGIMKGNASFGLYVKNLADHFYYQSGYVEGASGGFNTAIVGAPRTFGAELTYRF